MTAIEWKHGFLIMVAAFRVSVSKWKFSDLNCEMDVTFTEFCAFDHLLVFLLFSNLKRWLWQRFVQNSAVLKSKLSLKAPQSARKGPSGSAHTKQRSAQQPVHKTALERADSTIRFKKKTLNPAAHTDLCCSSVGADQNAGQPKTDRRNISPKCGNTQKLLLENQ